MNQSGPAARALMACLGEESRFRLVQALMGGARCVTDLAGEVGLSQSCTTRHLQALESRHVVRGTRDGKRVLYRIRDDDPALLPLLHWALDRSGGAGPVRAERDPAPGRRAPRPRRARGVKRHSTKGGPARPGTGAITVEVPVRPDSPPPPPTGGETSGLADPPAARRRIVSSDIEDYLL